MAILVRMKKTGKSALLPASQARGLVKAGLAVLDFPVASQERAPADPLASEIKGMTGEAGGAVGKPRKPNKVGYKRRDMRAED